MESESDAINLCVTCNSEKPVSEFSKNNKKQCKDCHNKYRRERYRTNTEVRRKHLESSKNYAQKPENKTKIANFPSKRKQWGEKIYDWLNINPTDY